MPKLRLTAVAGAIFALSSNLAHGAGTTIQLPPLADAILNGNTSDLDPALLEALSGDFTFALGISIGSAFATDNLALAEVFTSGTVITHGQGGSGMVDTIAQAFSGPELARVMAWVQAQASSHPVSPE